MLLLRDMHDVCAFVLCCYVCVLFCWVFVLIAFRWRGGVCVFVVCLCFACGFMRVGVPQVGFLICFSLLWVACVVCCLWC